MQKPLAEDWFGYWQVRIQDPDQFIQIRTPAWSSYAATEMAKEWLISLAANFTLNPSHLTPEDTKDIFFMRKDSEGNSLDVSPVRTRQGFTSEQEWLTQSVLVPRIVIWEGQELEVPIEVAHSMACYIASRLDRQYSSPYCAHN